MDVVIKRRQYIQPFLFYNKLTGDITLEAPDTTEKIPNYEIYKLNRSTSKYISNYGESINLDSIYPELHDRYYLNNDKKHIDMYNHLTDYYGKEYSLYAIECLENCANKLNAYRFKFDNEIIHFNSKDIKIIYKSFVDNVQTNDYKIRKHFIEIEKIFGKNNVSCLMPNYHCIENLNDYLTVNYTIDDYFNIFKQYHVSGKKFDFENAKNSMQALFVYFDIYYSITYRIETMQLYIDEIRKNKLMSLFILDLLDFHNNVIYSCNFDEIYESSKYKENIFDREIYSDHFIAHIDSTFYYSKDNNIKKTNNIVLYRGRDKIWNLCGFIINDIIPNKVSDFENKTELLDKIKIVKEVIKLNYGK